MLLARLPTNDRFEDSEHNDELRCQWLEKKMIARTAMACGHLGNYTHGSLHRVQPVWH